MKNMNLDKIKKTNRNKTELKEEDEPVEDSNLASCFLFLVVSTGPLDFSTESNNIFQYSSSISFSL